MNIESIKERAKLGAAYLRSVVEFRDDPVDTDEWEYADAIDALLAEVERLTRIIENHSVPRSLFDVTVMENRKLQTTIAKAKVAVWSDPTDEEAGRLLPEVLRILNGDSK